MASRSNNSRRSWAYPDGRSINWSMGCVASAPHPKAGGSADPTDLWSERDVAVITYGDSLRRSGEPPLQVLLGFLRRYLSDMVSVVPPRGIPVRNDPDAPAWIWTQFARTPERTNI